jgi:hypothetical protein
LLKVLGQIFFFQSHNRFSFLAITFFSFKTNEIPMPEHLYGIAVKIQYQHITGKINRKECRGRDQTHCHSDPIQGK